MISVISFAIEVALLVLTPVYRTYKEMNRVEDGSKNVDDDDGGNSGNAGNDANNNKDSGDADQGGEPDKDGGAADANALDNNGSEYGGVAADGAGVAAEGAGVAAEGADVAADDGGVPDEKSGIFAGNDSVPVDKSADVSINKTDVSTEQAATMPAQPQSYTSAREDGDVDPTSNGVEDERRSVFMHWIVYGSFRVFDLVARPWLPSFDVIKIVVIVWLCLRGPEDVYENMVMPVLNEYAPIIDYWLDRYDEAVDQVVATTDVVRSAAADVTNVMTELGADDDVASTSGKATENAQWHSAVVR